MGGLHKYLKTNEGQMKEDLIRLMEAESPTMDKQAVDACGDVIRGLFKDYFNETPTVYPETVQGDHLSFTIGQGTKARVLFLVHFDTVWDKGRLTIEEKDGRLYGPGAFDMKSGIIQAVWSIKSLFDTGISLDGLTIDVLCTSDEEIGSQTSRTLIEETASKADLVLVTEGPVHENGALKTSRSGVGIYELIVRGHSSHAGSHHHAGRSAIKELAHQILHLEGMTDYSVGTTVSIGIVEGGTRVNVVPDYARATIDFRVKTMEEAERMVKAVEGLTPFTEGVTLEINGELNRPPMERTPDTVQLFAMMKEAASKVGMDLEEAHIGGGSDGNFTSGIGIPTIDGLGGYGDGAHANHEHIVIDELPKRTAMIAETLKQLQDHGFTKQSD
ncbi:M20 family metallopeptidase [Salisediminibacterium selenitireducens]|uniref:Peptidase M20 n=1 Tax=Bacillus selenitireducens (strain ATCC 700615 / DSM 15326 / MLS10) TaxID=439292 RepID=D6Y1A6_BACIE|nr:M20 family metallopeptidase [Salisediminibacterium selenitireducens]ADI00693.1 peptidase M20 [[Bacillus] selenitireducens MLS10]